jgi:hypothetical protein
MSNYSEQLLKQLTEYKRTRLGISEDGIYARNSRKYPHILPESQKWLNILEPFRSPNIQQYLEANRRIKLHGGFSHLNSSQAFAFNLFIPFFLEQIPGPLMDALGVSPDVTRWKPEYVPERKEGTNIDMAWWAPDGVPTYCEVKLTEREFGPAQKRKPEYLEKYTGKMAEFYVPDLVGKCPERFLEPKFFLDNYQIFRNIWFAAKDNKATVVFLMPKSNIRLWEQLDPIRSELNLSLKSRIRKIAIEDVLSALSAVSSPDWVAGHARRLQEKYLLSGWVLKT